MRLVYLANIRIPTEKAHGLQIMKACEAFASLGLAVELVVPRRKNPIAEDPFSYYGVQKNFKLVTIFNFDFLGLNWAGRLVFHFQSVVFTTLAMIRILSKNQKDVIFYSRDFILLLALCLIGLRPVAEIHDYRLRQSRRLVQFILNRSSRIIVNSNGTLEKLRQHYVFNESKTKVISNGVDLRFFNITESRSEAREILAIDTPKKIVAYLGRIETAGVDKGVGLLVAAFKLLEQHGSDSLFYIIGGPDDLARKFQADLAKLGFGPGKIKFAGHVSYRQVPLYLRAIDLAVIPLLAGRHAETTSPIKLFEFLAAGKTIIVPELSAFRTYLDEQSALFFKPDDAIDLAAKISLALAEPALAASLAAEARRQAEKFTWTNRAGEIINFL